MRILIKQAKLIDKNSKHHNKVVDVFITDGVVSKIESAIKSEADHVIDARGHILSAGFFDLHVNFREPGFEHKETLHSGCKAAAAGGFTGVLQMPSTDPPIQSKSEIELIRSKTKQELVDVYVSGALSKDLHGADLSEMFDMSSSGAVSFTDDKRSVQDAGLMLRALQYVKAFNGLIMSFPNDHHLSNHGQMNEGNANIGLGIKGIPAIAEETMIARDLKLAEYAESGIHFSTISTKGSVDLIRKAKAKGLKITCDVAAVNLLLNDSSLEEFDTNLKLMPPLRTAEDIAAIIEGLKDGTIDAICSDHQPEDVENKKKEFDLAAFGAEGVETAFSAALTALQKHLGIEQIIEKFTTSPRNILRLSQSGFEEGQHANFTLIDPSEEWMVMDEHILSHSKNNPLIGRKLIGRVKAVMNKGMFVSYEPALST